MAQELTQERLKELLHYDPETGVFTWKVRRGGAALGSVAGTIKRDGYRHIGLLGRYMLAHRIVWFLMFGVLPKQIDHINGNRDDNRASNLRECNAFQNMQNRSPVVKNISGARGVHPSRSLTNPWRALIRVNRKIVHLGNFSTVEAAACAYVEAKANLHPFQPTIRKEISAI